MTWWPGRSAARLLAATLAVSLLVTGCGDGLTARAPADDTDPWSETAVAYGLPPLPHPEVTFQPDVVIIEGGGRTVRSVSDDGLTWRLDARADGVDQLAPDKIMFVTGRGVGRVLGLFPDGDEVDVVLGPADITEVIRDGTFEISEIVLDDPVTYLAGDPLWADPDAVAEQDEFNAEGTGGELPGVVGDGGTGGELPGFTAFGWSGTPTVSDIPDGAAFGDGFVGEDGGVAGEFHTTLVEGDGSLALAAAQRPDRPRQPAPRRGNGGVEHRAGVHSAFSSCCTDGVGARVRYDKDGVRFVGTVTLTFQQPKAGFHLAIRGGTVTRADFTVDGGFGIKVDFEAGIQDGKRNQRVVFPLGAEFSFPIAQVLGVPLNFTISQSVIVTTAFGANVGTMRGSGEFSLAASLGYGYANGTFGPRIDEKFQRRSSLINSLSGVPVGVMGLIIEHRVRFMVGFSSFLLKAGVYLELRTSYGMTLGSAIGAVATLTSGFVQCRGVGIGVHAVFGIGYTILEPVAKVVNSFLSLFKLKPISTSGGINSKPVRIYANQEVVPQVPLCADPLPR